MIKSKGYAGFDSKTPLKPYHFERREVGEFDILIKIKYCGVCHSDIHTVRNEWGGAKYPLVPGHEIIGVVEQVGTGVSKHQVGDTVGVGCMVNSCGHCDECRLHMEQFCHEGAIFTYNTLESDGKTTKGGYSDNIVVNEQFVLSVPSHLNLAQAAPLLCAGITTYSPLKHWNIKAGDKVGIIGLGGLGHMAVKFAHAFGAQVVVFTTSQKKISDALSMGAHEVVLSTHREEMLKHNNSFDFILDTVSAPHDVNAYMALLKYEKTLCMVGVSPTPHQIASSSLFMGRKNLSGSLIGGIAETQEMLNFCGEHQITSTIEMISITEINEAYSRILKSDVNYRFVIDMASLNQRP
jgi:uncharacterized zinc-type alcohol dehydrogenase-like protein